MTTCFAGVDVGSTTSKAVVIDRDGQVLARALRPEGIGSTAGETVLREAVEEACGGFEGVGFIVATGYGRKIFPHSDRQVSELSCHTRGVAHVVPGVRTLIDVGGQDAKAMSINAEGVMTAFQMNDKCAAGTGRFLEVMASILHVGIGDLETEYFASTDPVKISSTCTVFSESEVISQLARGAKREDVVAGICQSVASRFAALVSRVGVEPKVCISGGVARNHGVRDALARDLGVPIEAPPYAQYMGALGASLYAREFAKNKS
ncbi:MAG: acyl-CoA dehydratase activase [Pauljensenia sp.]